MKYGEILEKDEHGPKPIWEKNPLDEEGVAAPAESNLEHALILRLDVNAATGRGIFNEYENITSHLTFHREWLQSYKLDSKHLSVVEVSGENMGHYSNPARRF